MSSVTISGFPPSQNSQEPVSVVDLTGISKSHLPQKQTTIDNFFKKSSATASSAQSEFQWQPTFSDYGEDMSVDFDHSYLGFLNDCGVPRSHVMNQGRDDRDLEHELESSRDAMQKFSFFQ